MSCLEALIIRIMYCPTCGQSMRGSTSWELLLRQMITLTSEVWRVFWQPGKGTCFALIMNTISYIARESFITLVSILALQAT